MAEPEFIAADYHRRSLCRKQKQHGIFHLLQTQLQNGFLSCLSLRSAVPADIIGFPVTVFLAVGFIMLSVKRHQIGQRKAGIVRNIIDNARLFGIFLPQIKHGLKGTLVAFQEMPGSVHKIIVIYRQVFIYGYIIVIIDFPAGNILIKKLGVPKHGLRSEQSRRHMHSE